jgi:hypothetical protein
VAGRLAHNPIAVVWCARRASTRAAPAAGAGVVDGSVADGELPTEAGELARHRDRGDAGPLAAFGLQPSAAAVEAPLDAPAEVHHPGFLAALAPLERRGRAGSRPDRAPRPGRRSAAPPASHGGAGSNSHPPADRARAAARTSRSGGGPASDRRADHRGSAPGPAAARTGFAEMDAHVSKIVVGRGPPPARTLADLDRRRVAAVEVIIDDPGGRYAGRSRIRFSRARSLRLARRTAGAMNGASQREKPDGWPRFRSRIRAPPSGASSQA